MNRWITLTLIALLNVLSFVGFMIAHGHGLKLGMVAMAILAGVGGWYAAEFLASLRRKR